MLLDAGPALAVSQDFWCPSPSRRLLHHRLDAVDDEVAEELRGDESALAEIGRTVEQECAISTAIRAYVQISSRIAKEW